MFSSIKLGAVCLSLLFMVPLMSRGAPLRVLYFSKSSGFEHSVVRRVDGAPSYSERVLTKLAEGRDIDFTFSKDGSLFTREYLAGFDVIMFYTSGDLCSVGTDGQPALTPEGKQALLDAVVAGKGFVSVHSGSDTFRIGEPDGGNPEDRAGRHVVPGKGPDVYIQMVGGEFMGHGEQQVARARVVDRQFPGCDELGDAVECHEEWYSLKEFAPDLHVLLVMETDGMKGHPYRRPSYPLAWARLHGRGRVWYSAMGHCEDVWDNPKFQAMLLGGILWAGGRAPASVSANRAEVTPAADRLPPAQ